MTLLSRSSDVPESYISIQTSYTAAHDPTTYNFQASIGFRVASRADCFIDMLTERGNLGSVATDSTDKCVMENIAVVSAHRHTAMLHAACPLAPCSGP